MNTRHLAKSLQERFSIIYVRVTHIARKHILLEELQEFYTTLQLSQKIGKATKEKDAETRRRNSFRRTSQRLSMQLMRVRTNFYDEITIHFLSDVSATATLSCFPILFVFTLPHW